LIKSIALISAPWPLYNRPSIQLAALKAYLRARHPRIDVIAHHSYLKIAESIGYSTYQEISKRTWLAEPVYAALLYPERLARIEDVFLKHVKRGSTLASVNFQKLSRKIEEATNRFIDRNDWQQFGLIGFSICLCQLTASLYFIKRIKSLCPTTKIVIGGSMFSGDTLADFIKAEPNIDFGVSGEGEKPLSDLVTYLSDSYGQSEPLALPGLVSARTDKLNRAPTNNQIRDLSDLPLPEFDDYFDLLQSFSPDRTFFPTLPVEVSRGCWWQRQAPDKTFSGCAFCNLNRQWKGYRTKNALKVIDEIEHLVSKHRTLSLAFMDNLLPIKESKRIFEQLYETKKDYRLFGEIRADTPWRSLLAMKKAGVTEVQIGIEALSSRLLKRMNKGTTAIQNIEAMKNCEELGLINTSNLILQFPGSGRQDVEETLNHLDYVTAYRPMRAVTFWLGLGSPVWINPGRFDIQSIFNHPNWAQILADKRFDKINLMIQAYRGDRTRQKKLWRTVSTKVKKWNDMYIWLHRKPGSGPILSYRDGGDFLTIRQRRYRLETITHRVVGPSRKIYLFCRRTRSLEKILKRFPRIDERQMRSFLDMMVAKKLMFEENRNYLSLAVARRIKIA
jgi:ribosomal peptide maturation radical SAM protein 1